MASFSSSLFLGFEELERALEQATRASSDGYPPYNIERVYNSDEPQSAPIIRISLAVAGFGEDDLEIIEEHKKLTITGTNSDTQERDFLHRGIAARGFKKSFVMADGIEVSHAHIKNGLLMIDLKQTEPQRQSRRIAINSDV